MGGNSGNWAIPSGALRERQAQGERRQLSFKLLGSDGGHGSQALHRIFALNCSSSIGVTVLEV